MRIPFYENPDDTHCYQAVIRMVLEYYLPNREFTWGNLDTITAKEQDMWTWSMAGMIWLHDNGFEVHDVENFDYEKFAKEGKHYLTKLFGKEVADEADIHSNIARELGHAKQMLAANLCEMRVPAFSELKDRLDDGYLLICNVNSRTLNHKPGYVGHFVLLTGYYDTHLIMHDPGPPGIEHRKVAFSDFEKAWAYPNEQAQNYIAIRKLNAKTL